MNIFELHWGDYDESQSWLFSHEIKTEEEFKEDVNKLLIERGEDYLQQEESWSNAQRWIEYVSNCLGELGYQKVKTSKYSFLGSSMLGCSDEDAVEAEWMRVVGEDLYIKAIEHNKKVLRTL